MFGTLHRPASARALSILVIDEHEDGGQSTAELLALHGHTVRVATCGADALREAAAAPPDVVLVEVRLWGMDGWQVVARLRERSAKQPLIVAVTTAGEASARLRSAAVGIDLHLVKPVDPSVLVGLLARAQGGLG